MCKELREKGEMFILETLKKQLKNGTLQNIYLFYGEEEYLKEMYLKRIENIVLPDGLRDINRFVMDSPKDVSKIIDTLEMLPCFAQKKLVIVKDSMFFKAGKKGSREDLELLIDRVPSHTCLIFFEKEIDKRLKLVKDIGKKGLVVEFKIQQPSILAKWVVKEFKDRGKAINNGAVMKLIDYSDGAMFSIINEIDKLCMYGCDKKEIDVLDVENVCTKSISIRIFDLLDNISSGNKDLAFKNLKEMLILKEPIQRIMFMLIKHVRQLLEMKLLTEEGLLLNDCVGKMGISPYTGKKLFSQIRHFGVDKLKLVLKEMCLLDYKIKMGEIKDLLAVDIIMSLLMG